MRSALFLALLVPLSAAAASIIEFKSIQFEGEEAGGSGHLTLTCTPPPINRIVVLLKASGGSAEAADLKYVNSLPVDRASWQAGWPVHLLTGNLETLVGIWIKSDGAPEPDETLHFKLSVLDGDAVVGAQSNAVFTIRNGSPSIWVDVRPVAAEGTPVRCPLYRYGDTNIALSGDRRAAGCSAIDGV